MDDRNILYSFFCNRMDREPDSEAVYDYEAGTRYTYGELRLRSYRLANFLKKEVGVRQGDRVAILSRNNMVYIDTFYSTLYTGAITTSYNVNINALELKEMLQNEQPLVLFFEKEFEQKVSDIIHFSNLKHFVMLGDGNNLFGPYYYNDIISYYDQTEPYICSLHLADTLNLMHTGGTTGLPKAAKISFGASFLNVTGQQNTWNLTNADRTLAYLPMFHTATWNTVVMPILYAGGRCVLLKQFDVKKIFEIISKEKLTFIWGVPTVYRKMMSDPSFLEVDFSSINRCRCGAAPPSLDMMESFWRKGISFCNGYGMTETSPGNLSFPAKDLTIHTLRKKRTSCGKLMPFNEAVIVDENGMEVPTGTHGELLLKGGVLFSGYWNDEQATKAAMKDCWFRTGDMAMVDEDGYYYVVGRKKNMYITNGENIFPNEIESAIYAHPAVVEACVIGIADEEKGEVGKALVVLKPEEKLQEDELKQFLKERLTSIKCPAYIVFIDEIPKNDVGKVYLSFIHQMYGSSN